MITLFKVVVVSSNTNVVLSATIDGKEVSSSAFDCLMNKIHLATVRGSCTSRFSLNGSNRVATHLISNQ